MHATSHTTTYPKVRRSVVLIGIPFRIVALLVLLHYSSTLIMNHPFLIVANFKETLELYCFLDTIPRREIMTL
jgi:hypothetical protein